jgi:hypothetical protein
MPLPKELLTEIQWLLRKPSEWFSVPEIQKRRPELFASEFVKTGTGEHFSVSHQPDQVRRDLEGFAAVVLERELRRYESEIARVLADNSVTPSLEDDALLVSTLTQYVKESVEEIRSQIHSIVGKIDYELPAPWSKVEDTGKRIASELSVTVRLAGEISRLEIVEAGYETPSDTGFAQTKIERFYSQYSKIPHPFDVSQSLELSPVELRNTTRLLLYVVFHQVKEHRLTGFESKFVSTFSRYLTCPRDLSASTVEQVAALFEPFLKKLALLFDVRDATNNPIWTRGLEGLIAGLSLTAADLRNADDAYWRSQGVEAAVLRLAYQLRHKGAHEAHEYPYYERERNAYFVFGALAVATRILIAVRPEVAKVIEHQSDVDSIRDLFVRVDELVEGRDGPRIGAETPAVPSRLHKLVAFTRRAQGIWPTCSHELLEGLESEYLSVKDELIESDRQADIESYLEDMRPDDY